MTAFATHHQALKSQLTCEFSRLWSIAALKGLKNVETAAAEFEKSKLLVESTSRDGEVDVHASATVGAIDAVDAAFAEFQLTSATEISAPGDRKLRAALAEFNNIITTPATVNPSPWLLAAPDSFKPTENGCAISIEHLVTVLPDGAIAVADEAVASVKPLQVAAALFENACAECNTSAAVLDTVLGNAAGARNAASKPPGMLPSAVEAARREQATAAEEAAVDWTAELKLEHTAAWVGSSAAVATVEAWLARRSRLVAEVKDRLRHCDLVNHASFVTHAELWNGLHSKLPDPDGEAVSQYMHSWANSLAEVQRSWCDETFVRGTAANALDELFASTAEIIADDPDEIAAAAEAGTVPASAAAAAAVAEARTAMAAAPGLLAGVMPPRMDKTATEASQASQIISAIADPVARRSMVESKDFRRRLKKIESRASDSLIAAVNATVAALSNPVLLGAVLAVFGANARADAAAEAARLEDAREEADVVRSELQAAAAELRADVAPFVSAGVDRVFLCAGWLLFKRLSEAYGDTVTAGRQEELLGLEAGAAAAPGVAKMVAITGEGDTAKNKKKKKKKKKGKSAECENAGGDDVGDDDTAAEYPTATQADAVDLSVRAADTLSTDVPVLNSRPPPGLDAKPFEGALISTAPSMEKQESPIQTRAPAAAGVSFREFAAAAASAQAEAPSVALKAKTPVRSTRTSIEAMTQQQLKLVPSMKRPELEELCITALQHREELREQNAELVISKMRLQSDLLRVQDALAEAQSELARHTKASARLGVGGGGSRSSRGNQHKDFSIDFTPAPGSRWAAQ